MARDPDSSSDLSLDSFAELGLEHKKDGHRWEDEKAGVQPQADGQ